MAKSCGYQFQRLDSFAFRIPLLYHEDSSKKRSYWGACMTILLWVIAIIYLVFIFDEAFSPSQQIINTKEYDVDLLN